VLGRPIRYVQITDQQWTEAAKDRINAHAINHLSHLWQYFRNGEDKFQVTDSIRVVTGKKPQTLEEFFQSDAALPEVS